MKRYISANDDWREHNHPYGFEVTDYDTDLESAVFEFCDELGGYADYNQKVESVAEEWSMPTDLAKKYVWNWSIQPNVDDEEEEP